MTKPGRCAGFTLIEAVLAIAVTGILAAIVAVFIQRPVQGYFDVARRAALTDVADTAMRRISRELRSALPNSVRNPADGSDQCIEFMPTKGGARYRSEVGVAGDDALDFTTADASFDMLWSNGSLPSANQLAAGDVVVVYNDGTSSGNAYAGGNAIRIAALAAGFSTGTTRVSFVDAATGVPFNRKQLPAASPSRRFQVVPAAEHVIGFGCSGDALFRYARTLSAARSQPANCAAVSSGAGSVLLANDVTACSIRYQGTDLNRQGLVSMTLELTQGGERVQLYQQVHVSNSP